MNENYNWRKIILILLGCILLVIAAISFSQYWFYGKITVTASGPNTTISITAVSEDEEHETIKGKDRLTARVKPGEYIVTVTGNSVGRTKLADVQARKTSRINLKPINTTGVSPAAYVDARDIYASGSYLLYLDAKNNDVKKIGLDNNPSVIGAHYPLQTVKWINGLLGVGQDSLGRLYMIDLAKNQISPLKVPFSYKEGVAVNYAVADNGQIYISVGRDVYMGSSDGSFKKVFTARTSRPELAATKDKVMVSDNLGEGNTTEPYVSTVGKDGKIAGRNFESNLASWSPNGKYLALAAEAGASLTDAKLNLLETVPTNLFISHFAWLNDEVLFFSSDDQLWVYNLRSRSANLVANMPRGEGIADLSISSDGSYVYLVSADSKSNYVIRRIGLNNQPVPIYLYKLQDILPLDLETYTVGAIAFGDQPLIIVDPKRSGQNINYVEATSKELQLRGFDVSKFRFELVPARPPLTVQ